MTAAATPMIDPADLPENPSEDRANLDRQLAKLDRLGDLGLQIVEALADQAKGGRIVVVGDLALAYDRVARAVRMTVMLRSRLVAEGRETAAKPASAAGAAADPAAARKDAISRVIKRIAQGDERLDGFQMAWAAREARERLEHDDIYGEVMSQPVSELVGRICHDLGLNPDWAQLAQEAWAQDEIDRGDVGLALQDYLDEEADDDDGGGEEADDPPPPVSTIPTFREYAQTLAADPAICAAAGRPSG